MFICKINLNSEGEFMRIIQQEEKWFSGPEGQVQFSQTTEFEEKIAFVYSYLRAIRKNDNTANDQNALFKIAFLLADSVLSSNLPYAKLPDFLDETKNPFIAYVKNISGIGNNMVLYVAFLSILHEIVNPFVTGDWIYDLQTMQETEISKKLKSLNHEFIPSNSSLFCINPDDYKIDEDKESIQLEIIWLFTNSDK